MRQRYEATKVDSLKPRKYIHLGLVDVAGEGGGHHRERDQVRVPESGYGYCLPPYGTAYLRALRTTRTRIRTRSCRVDVAGEGGGHHLLLRLYYSPALRDTKVYEP